MTTPFSTPARSAALVLALLAAGGCADGGGVAGPGGEPGAGRAAEGAAARVVRVVDGDTLIARLGGDDVRVRLIGVDAPESVTPDRPVECFGPQAGARLRALLPEGVRVRVATDPSQGPRDRFGRTLGEVTRAGQALTVNEALVAGGHARVFRGDGRARILPRLRDAERRARSEGRGLWAACRGAG
jgi:micrococcal nuclease